MNLWFRPWSNKPEGHGYGGNPADQLGQWITYDCINCTPQFSGPKATITPLWSQPEGNVDYHSWAEVCADYGTWTIVPTSTTWDPTNLQLRSPGWDNSTTPVGSSKSTGTGTGLNFEVGARKFAHSNIWSNQGVNTNWFPESLNFKGYADTFTIAVEYGTEEEPDVVETTYDFEPAADAKEPQLISCNLRSRCEGDWDPTGWTNHFINYAAIWENSGVWKLFRTKLFGSALTEPSQAEEGIYSEDGNTVTCRYVDISDGSGGIPVPVTLRARDPGGTLYDNLYGGNYISAIGEVRRKPWGNVKMWYIWTCAGNVVNYTYP